jgi:uncharacterized membrane protein required for colicin V production
MGLDLAWGVIILVAAYRGWLQGFVSQAVRIAGLIACVYLADPVRYHAKPHVLPYLPTIQSDLVDRLLWWVAAVVTYVVIVGVSMLVIKLTRRPEIPGLSQSGRNDQFAGFLFGAVKGLVIVAFLTAGIQKFAMNQIKSISWAEEQVKTSWAIRCNEEYRPGARIWSSRPVRHFVNHIHRMGVQNPAEAIQTPAGADGEERKPVRTAIRPGRAEIPDADANALESPSSSPASPSPPSPESLVPRPELDKP